MVIRNVHFYCQWAYWWKLSIFPQSYLLSILSVNEFEASIQTINPHNNYHPVANLPPHRHLTLIRRLQQLGNDWWAIDDRKISSFGSKIRIVWNCLAGHSGMWRSCPDAREQPFVFSSHSFHWHNGERNFRVGWSLKVTVAKEDSLLFSAVCVPHTSGSRNL